MVHSTELRWNAGIRWAFANTGRTEALVSVIFFRFR